MHWWLMKEKTWWLNNAEYIQSQNEERGKKANYLQKTYDDEKHEPGWG